MLKWGEKGAVTVTTKIILDTDPGIDDAAAITLALNHPEIEVALMTTVVGNVTVDKTTINALKLAEFYQSDVPIAKGAAQPLLRVHEDASYVHGVSGLAGADLPTPSRQPLPSHAVEAMRQTLLAATEPLTLVPIGALTNVALLFSQYPEVKAKVDRIVLMGGGLFAGNTTSHAEFNIYTDPHAAKMVFAAGVPLVMVGLDVTTKALLSPANLTRLADLGRAGAMLRQLFWHYHDESAPAGIAMHDVCAIFYLLHPDKVKTVDYYVDVVVAGPAAGATVADIRRAYHETTNATVCLDIDVAFFNQWFMDNIARLA